MNIGKALQEVGEKLDWIDAQLQAMLDNQPCGCYGCDNGVQPGHIYCEQADQKMIRLEEAGKVVRFLDDGRWRWEVV